LKLSRTVTDLALSAAAGYVGTKAMEPVSMRLYQWESEADRAQEDAARPGEPYRIAAEKLSRLAGFDLSEKQLSRLALVFHYGLALQWAPLYPLLRRRTQLAPLPAGLLTGAAMSVVADELMTPAFGFSAPNLEYPLVTHLRGFAAHLVFGTAVAATVETGWAMLGRGPSPRRSASDSRRRATSVLAS
jgi:hypothetical protein